MSEAHSLPRWTLDEARAWSRVQPWWIGCNFVPSTACNQLEMWQAESFDPAEAAFLGTILPGKCEVAMEEESR